MQAMSSCNIIASHLTGVTWCFSASRGRNMPTILNKLELEFYFMNCLQGIAILHRTRSSYHQQKRWFQQAVSSIQKNCQMVTYKPFMEPSWNLTKWLFSNYHAVKIRRLKIAITLLTGFVKERSPISMLRRWTLWSYRFLINAFNRSEVIKSFISGEWYTVWS